MDGRLKDYQRNGDTGLWRHRPPVCHLQENRANSLFEFVFPSGRQALSTALQKAGLGRSNRIALPEWSSHCVISAAGKVATPIPMNEVIRYNIKVDAILLYEQWGWPLLPTIKSQLLESSKNTIIILDRVDSSDIDNENRINFYPETKQIDIISLSKLIGLAGGGLAKINGKYLPFEYDSKDERLSDHLWRGKNINFFSDKLLHLHKENTQLLHPDLVQWLCKNDLLSALNEEYCKRRENLSLLINSSLSCNWSDWMFSAFEQGAGPGIVPLFKDASDNDLKSRKLYIKIKHHIETEIYHFNWSGNPLYPEYKKCLAFPTHGLIEDIGLIISDLENNNEK